jgi:hypothetical protein
MTDWPSLMVAMNSRYIPGVSSISTRFDIGENPQLLIIRVIQCTMYIVN